MFTSKIPGVTQKRVIIFLLSFFQYAFIHCTRSTWSYVSGRMTNAPYNYFSPDYLGYINFAFLFFYGVALSVMSLKIFVLAGTFTTSVLFTLIGVMINCQISQNYVYLILQTFNGISQGTAWPGLLAILNNWFMTDKKVILLGIFAACTNVGDIFGDVYSGSMIGRADLPLYAPVYLAALSLFLLSVLNVFFLVNTPDPELKKQMIQEYEDQNNSIPSKDLQLTMIENQYTINGVNTAQNTEIIIVSDNPKLQSFKFEPPQLNYFTAWFVPGVAIYALAFGCVKAVYYILGFWLPSYLDSKSVPDVAWIAAQTDVGSIPGGIIVCCIGYYFNKRAVVIVPSLWIGTVIMISVNYSGDLKHEVAGYIGLIFLTGLFIGGVYNNISSAITVELSNQPELRNRKQATATVVSVIMGYGAMFAAINQLVVPHVEKYLFLYCGMLAIIAGLLLIPFLIREVKRQKQKF